MVDNPILITPEDARRMLASLPKKEDKVLQVLDKLLLFEQHEQYLDVRRTFREYIHTKFH